MYLPRSDTLLSGVRKDFVLQLQVARMQQVMYMHSDHCYCHSRLGSFPQPDIPLADTDRKCTCLAACPKDQHSPAFPVPLQSKHLVAFMLGQQGAEGGCHPVISPQRSHAPVPTLPIRIAALQGGSGVTTGWRG